MYFKRILNKSFVILMSIFVIVISMGLNVSKFCCSENIEIFLSNNISSCSELQTIPSKKDQLNVSCCQYEIEKNCCPENKDNSCSSDIKILKFVFESFISIKESQFSVSNILLTNYHQCIKKDNNHVLNNLIYTISLRHIFKPELSKIQSFLL